MYINKVYCFFVYGLDLRLLYILAMRMDTNNQSTFVNPNNYDHRQSTVEFCDRLSHKKPQCKEKGPDFKVPRHMPPYQVTLFLD